MYAFRTKIAERFHMRIKQLAMWHNRGRNQIEYIFKKSETYNPKRKQENLENFLKLFVRTNVKYFLKFSLRSSISIKYIKL